MDWGSDSGSVHTPQARGDFPVTPVPMGVTEEGPWPQRTSAESCWRKHALEGPILSWSEGKTVCQWVLGQGTFKSIRKLMGVLVGK